jgi:hypothetical protein
MATSSIGLRGLIWDKTPESWQTVILREKCKNDYIEAVYAAIPKKKRGNNWKAGKTWLTCHGILCQKYQLTYTVAAYSKKPKEFWQDIINKIDAYELNCN